MAHHLKSLVSTATQKTERVFLVGLELKSRSRFDVDDSLNELAELATTAGATVTGRATQRLESPVAGTFIGTGKAAELAAQCKELEVDTIVFDDELSGAQARNLEKIFFRISIL